jgi:hypothetical protein
MWVKVLPSFPFSMAPFLNLWLSVALISY